MIYGFSFMPLVMFLVYDTCGLCFSLNSVVLSMYSWELWMWKHLASWSNFEGELNQSGVARNTTKHVMMLVSKPDLIRFQMASSQVEWNFIKSSRRKSFFGAFDINFPTDSDTTNTEIKFTSWSAANCNLFYVMFATFFASPLASFSPEKLPRKFPQ